MVKETRIAQPRSEAPLRIRKGFTFNDQGFRHPVEPSGRPCAFKSKQRGSIIIFLVEFDMVSTLRESRKQFM